MDPTEISTEKLSISHH